MKIIEKLNSKLTDIKFNLAKQHKIKLAEVSTDRGTLYYEGELEKGTEVRAIDEDGAYVLPENGDYVEGTQIIEVIDGIVVDIRPIDSDESPELMDEKKEELIEELPSPISGEVSAEDINAVIDVVKGVILELKAHKEEFRAAMKLSVQDYAENGNDVQKDVKRESKSQLSKFNL